MKPKKGMISAQFNWVFILIAGVLILLFFGSLILKARESSKITIAETILTNMQTIMTGAEVSVKTINPIKIPDEEIKVSCNSLSVGKVSKSITKNKIVFAPEIIDGTTLLAWAIDWNAPYHVTNFLYLTTPNIKYVFIGSDTERIFNLLPDKINKKKVGPSNVPNTGNYIELIFFNGQNTPSLPSSLNNFPDNKVSAINVETNTDEIEFYKKEGNSLESTGNADYIGDPMILGAVFSGNYEDYKCNVEKAFNKLKIVSMVYRERTEVLAASGCAPSYYDTWPLSYIITHSKDVNIDINEIKRNIEEIKMYNKHLQSESCPTIY